MAGSRKAGTTWLYSNLLSDPNVNVSSLVKESRFFLGAMTEQSYDELYDSSSGSPRIEVDTALWSSPNAASQISEYNATARVAIILRNPATWAVSRYIHAARKGEIGRQASIGEFLRYDSEAISELAYRENVLRFEAEKLETRVFPYEAIAEQPSLFYHTIRDFLIGGNSGFTHSHPGLNLEPVNTSRVSGSAATSKLLSDVAKRARRVGLHKVVNSAKKLPITGLLERPTSLEEKADLADEAAIAIGDLYSESAEFWGEISWK